MPESTRNKQTRADVKLLLQAQHGGHFDELPPELRAALTRQLQRLSEDDAAKKVAQRLYHAVNVVRRGWRCNNTRIAAEYLQLVKAGKWPELSYAALIKQCRKCDLDKFLLLVKKEHGIELE